MTPKPTKPEVQLLLKRLADGPTKSKTPYRREFAGTAIRCVENEGLAATETATLHFRDFNLKDRWVEFLPQNAESIVRRRLSDDTARHITEMIRQRGAHPDDLICRYAPRLRPNRRSPTFGWAGAVSEEVRLVDFDPERFHIKTLKWIWADDHPNLTDQEQLTAMLARFVLRWAYRYQQEALFQRIYENSQVLRPSWAYPQWHKDQTKNAGHPSGLNNPSRNEEPSLKPV